MTRRIWKVFCTGGPEGPHLFGQFKVFALAVWHLHLPCLMARKLRRPQDTKER